MVNGGLRAICESIGRFSVRSDDEKPGIHHANKERKNDRQHGEPDGCEKRAAVTGYGGSFHRPMIASPYPTTANNQLAELKP